MAPDQAFFLKDNVKLRLLNARLSVLARQFDAARGDLRFVSGDVAAHHADMVAAAGERDVWVVGGGDLAGQFADAGLLDDLWVQYAPVALGAGAPLLLPRRLELRLEEVARNRDFACARYAVVR